MTKIAKKTNKIILSQNGRYWNKAKPCISGVRFIIPVEEGEFVPINWFTKDMTQ
jgi:hypothetical protein